MSQLAQKTTNPKITILNGQMMTTSLNVAEVFGRRHDRVIRAVKSLGCSDGFRVLNFGETLKTVTMPKGGKRKTIVYNITRDGFTFLAMGFTGKPAAEFKEGYIAAFNKMETELLKKCEQPALADTISPKQKLAIREAMNDKVYNSNKTANKTTFSAEYKKFYHAFSISKYEELPADQFDAAITFLGEWIPAKAITENTSAAKEITATTTPAPSNMVLVRRDNLNALNNRCQLASTRYKAIDEIERRAARLATDAEELRRQMVDFRYLTIDSVREAAAMVSDMVAA